MLKPTCKLKLAIKLGALLSGDKIDWKCIFKMCRRQRVNLNLLVDHSGVSRFPARLFFHSLLTSPDKNDVAAFHTFLVELEDQNCTRASGLYFDVYRRPGDASESKVIPICEAICNEIELDAKTVSDYFSVYLHCLLKLNGMEKTFTRLSRLLKNDETLTKADLKNGIKFLAVMQQGKMSTK